jgi:hypothetical protein
VAFGEYAEMIENGVLAGGTYPTVGVAHVVCEEDEPSIGLVEGDWERWQSARHGELMLLLLVNYRV